jgi:hypothetical protein
MPIFETSFAGNQSVLKAWCHIISYSKEMWMVMIKQGENAKTALDATDRTIDSKTKIGCIFVAT